MDSWLGSSQQQLIEQLGPPDRTTSNGGDGKILIYVKAVDNQYVHQTMYFYRMFYVGENGKIYNWLTKRSYQPPQRVIVTLN